MRGSRLITLLVAALVGGGCGGGLSPAEVDGLYLLDPSSSQLYATESGSIELTLAGTAERRVTYIIAARETVYVNRGTYRVGKRGVVDLRLAEQVNEWRPRTTLIGDVLTIRHPHPADGPDVVEVYRRQE